MFATLMLTLAIVGIALIGLCFNLIFRKKPFPETHVGHNKEMKKRGITVLSLILAAALIVAGVAEGQAKEVLMKAVRVCLECIGVG